VKEGREIFLERGVQMKKQILAASVGGAVAQQLKDKEHDFDEAQYNATDTFLEEELKKTLKSVDDLRQARKNAKMFLVVSEYVTKMDEMLLGSCSARAVKRVKLEH
jgi:hypothetical protein